MSVIPAVLWPESLLSQIYQPLHLVLLLALQFSPGCPLPEIVFRLHASLQVFELRPRRCDKPVLDRAEHAHHGRWLLVSDLPRHGGLWSQLLQH